MLNSSSRVYIPFAAVLSFLIVDGYANAEVQHSRYVTTWVEYEQVVLKALRIEVDVQKLRQHTTTNEAIEWILKEVGYRLSDSEIASKPRRVLTARRLPSKASESGTVTVKEALIRLLPNGWRIAFDPRDKLAALERCDGALNL